MQPTPGEKCSQKNRAPRSTFRRDPALYDDTSTHSDRLIAIVAYRRGCRCDNCRAYKREESRQWRKRYGSPSARWPVPIEKRREYSRRVNYGLGPGEYEQMQAAQEGRCWICQRDIGDKLVVDHCHETGVVRGLLCRNCNLLLGLAQDSMKTLTRATEYLERSKKAT